MPQIIKKGNAEIAAVFAEGANDESPEPLTRYVAALNRPPPPVVVKHDRLVAECYRNTVKAGIVDAMIRDKRVFLMGEYVGRYGGRYGGCCAVRKGLPDTVGPARIRPLSESGFTGAGIGAAVAGIRPIVELMALNFSLRALHQILNTAAVRPHMSSNQLGVPVVGRMATEAGKKLAAQHSHSLEGWYAQTRVSRFWPLRRSTTRARCCGSFLKILMRC